MGRVSRWFKGLFNFTDSGGKEDKRNSNSQQKDRGRRSIDSVIVNTLRHQCFSGKDFSPAAAEDACLRSSKFPETGKDQNVHAIAVAAATAAAANAAVAAARAAVKVVRLTTEHHGWGKAPRDERWSAAVKIQTLFRGYLARKALSALRGLVKLQALVRGDLVRRQVDVTLQRMQALVRAQDAAQAQSWRSHHPSWKSNMDDKFIAAPIHSRRSSASLDVRTVKATQETQRLIKIPDSWDLDLISVDSYFFGEPFNKGQPTRPSYMASTQSFEAKTTRSLSTPRQRPRSGEMGRRLSLEEMMGVDGTSSRLRRAIDFRNYHKMI
ncbi:hypothetical protein SAY86_002763 [Trapa natans]|uniref:DUF4005 domain-containing protein n=1 Tax=Trapa natans TaxID=22666 RepID=A0AAN7LKS0_TRANT|nr:hypothetical protein SAY86_002763 [Trapa natans]